MIKAAGIKAFFLDRENTRKIVQEKAWKNIGELLQIFHNKTAFSSLLKIS